MIEQAKFEQREVEENVHQILQDQHNTQNENTLTGTFFKEISAIESIDQLYDWYQFNKSSINTFQLLSVLRNMNSMLKNLIKKGGSNATIKEAKEKGLVMQTEILKKVLQNKTQLDATNTNQMLLTLSNSSLEFSSILTKNELQEIEKHIMINLSEFQKQGLATTLCSMLALKYVPESLLSEVSLMNQLTTFKPEDCYMMIRELVNQKITNQQVLYQKLWERVHGMHLKVFNKRCASIIALITNYQKLIPENHDENIRTMQAFIDRYSSTILNAENQDEVYWTIKNVKTFIDLTENNISNVSLDSNSFFLQCSNVMMNSNTNLNPGMILQMFSQFSEFPHIRQMFLVNVLKQMKEDKVDIRSFNLHQFTEFVELVAEYQPKDLQVFSKYLDTAIVQNFFPEKLLSKQLYDLSKLMHIFALNGDLEEGAAVYQFLINLKVQVTSNSSANNQFNTDKIYKSMIDLIWLMIYRETQIQEQLHQLNRSISTADSHPLIPKLLESLYSYQREEPLSKIEYLQLFQINIWIQKQVGEGKLPQVFSKCIPSNLLEVAEDRFHEYDKQIYDAEQTDIAKHLLELRVTFRENQRIHKMYRADIKLENQNTIIQLYSNDKYLAKKRKEQTLLGLEKMKQWWISNEDAQSYDVKYIEIEQWKKLQRIDKLKLLSRLTDKKIKNSL